MHLKGEDMGLVDSNINHVHKAFEKLDFFVVQDIFYYQERLNSRMSSFPQAQAFEKEGTFTNTERRIQRLYQVFEPLGDSKPDWQIIMNVANSLGAGWNYEASK